MPAALPPSLRLVLRSLAECFVPETGAASGSQWDLLESRVAEALAARPAMVRRQLGLFVRVLDAAARLRYAAGLNALDPARRGALLESFSRSPILPFRRGVWGLRTLIMLGWYTQPSVTEALGYRATAAGWEARR